MTLNEQQFKALEPYEEHFKTAINGKWTRHPGVAALDLMHGILCTVTKTDIRLNKGCSHCILRTITEVGTIYFADKAERNGSESGAKPERTGEKPKRTTTKRTKK